MMLRRTAGIAGIACPSLKAFQVGPVGMEAESSQMSCCSPVESFAVAVNYFKLLLLQLCKRYSFGVKGMDKNVINMDQAINTHFPRTSVRLPHILGSPSRY